MVARSLIVHTCMGRPARCAAEINRGVTIFTPALASGT